MDKKLIIIFLILFLVFDAVLAYVLLRNKNVPVAPTLTPKSTELNINTGIKPNNIVSTQGKHVQIYALTPHLPLVTTDAVSLIQDLNRIQFFGQHDKIVLSQNGTQTTITNQTITTLVIYINDPKGDLIYEDSYDYQKQTLSINLYVSNQAQNQPSSALLHSISQQLLGAAYDIIQASYPGGKSAFTNLGATKAYITVRQAKT